MRQKLSALASSTSRWVAATTRGIRTWPELLQKVILAPSYERWCFPVEAERTMRVLVIGRPCPFAPAYPVASMPIIHILLGESMGFVMMFADICSCRYGAAV